VASLSPELSKAPHAAQRPEAEPALRPHLVQIM
jgi:hypothetical protein